MAEEGYQIRSQTKAINQTYAWRTHKVSSAYSPTLSTADGCSSLYVYKQTYSHNCLMLQNSSH